MDEALIVERDVERSALSAALHAAVHGDGAMVVVEGQAGIGKSTLLEVVAAEAARLGIARLRGAGGPVAGAVPFAVARDILVPALRPGSGWDRAAVLADAAGLAAPALQATGLTGLTGEDVGHLQARASAVHGLCWLALNLASRPLLITIDDLHQSDPETLDWLGYLLGRLDGTRLLVVGATRPCEPGTPADRLLARLPAGRRLTPPPLSAAAVQALGAARAVSLSTAEAEEIVAATGGKPFLVEAMLAGSTTDPLRDVVRRIAEAAPHALDVARASAVLGEGASARHVAGLTGLSREVVGHAVAGLSAAHLMSGPDPVRLAHPLLEEAVLRVATDEQRGGAHRRAAELLAADGAPVDRIAAHLVLAPPSDDPRHAGWLSDAADDAAAAGAPTTAAAYLRRLLDEDLDPPARAHALHRLGLAEVETMAPRAAEHLAAAASLTVGDDRHATVRHDLAMALILAGDLPGARDVLMEQRGGEGVALDALADALGISLMNFADDAALRDLEERVRRERTYDGSPGDRRAAAALAFAGVRVGAPATECLAEARYAFDQPPGALARAAFAPAYVVGHLALKSSGAASEARALAERSRDWAAARGAHALFHVSAFRAADAAFGQGDLLAVQGLADDMFRAAADGLMPLLLLGVALPLCVRTQVEHGDATLARDMLTQFGMWDAPLDEHAFTEPLLARGLARLALGDASGALADLTACGRRQIETGHHNGATLSWRLGAAEALLRLGRAAEAAAVIADEVTVAERFGAPHALGTALVARARVEPDREAEQTLAEAVTLLAESGARLAEAKALVAYGAHLRRTQRRREARDQLRRAREIAAACGAPPVVRAAEEELAAAGARLVERPVTGVGALTPSERRVADLAASVMTNSQIAQALFVSLKTVEMHLGNAYAKLGVRGRHELAEALG
ncbi:AAA family ATPase [Nocardioides ultimimeridianus]